MNERPPVGPGGRAAATSPTSRWLLRLALLLVVLTGLVMLAILIEARRFDPVEHGALPVPADQILWAVTPDAGAADVVHRAP